MSTSILLDAQLCELGQLQVYVGTIVLVALHQKVFELGQLI